MIGGISGSGGSMAQMQQMKGTQGMGRQNRGERFNKLDTDKNGGIDQTELQTMTDQISSITGQQVNVEEVSKTFDANNDGLLAQDEMQSMMSALHEKMGGSSTIEWARTPCRQWQPTRQIQIRILPLCCWICSMEAKRIRKNIFLSTPRHNPRNRQASAAGRNEKDIQAAGSPLFNQMFSSGRRNSTTSPPLA